MRVNWCATAGALTGLLALGGPALAAGEVDPKAVVKTYADIAQALQARQRLMDEGRSVIDRTRTATEQHAAEVARLNELLQAGAIDQQTYARAVEDANDRALRSSQVWTDGATRFLKDYAAANNDAAAATERVFATAFSGAEDSLVGFISTGKLEFQGLIDSVLADLTRMTVRQTITAPLAGALQSARSPAAANSAYSMQAASPAGDRRLCAMRMLRSLIRHPGTTAVASPAPASCPTRSRSSRGAGS